VLGSQHDAIHAKYRVALHHDRLVPILLPVDDSRAGEHLELRIPVAHVLNESAERSMAGGDGILRAQERTRILSVGDPQGRVIAVGDLADPPGGDVGGVAKPLERRDGRRLLQGRERLNIVRLIHVMRLIRSR
jgi:hypothetical protein